MIVLRLYNQYNMGPTKIFLRSFSHTDDDTCTLSSYWSMITNEWYIFVSMKSICDHETHCSADNSVLLPRSPILRRARVGPVAEPSHYLASDVSFSAFCGNHEPKPGTRGPWLAGRRRQREFWTAIRPPGDPRKPAHDQYVLLQLHIIDFPRCWKLDLWETSPNFVYLRRPFGGGGETCFWLLHIFQHLQSAPLHQMCLIDSTPLE